MEEQKAPCGGEPGLEQEGGRRNERGLEGEGERAADPDLPREYPWSRDNAREVLGPAPCATLLRHSRPGQGWMAMPKIATLTPPDSKPHHPE